MQSNDLFLFLKDIQSQKTTEIKKPKTPKKVITRKSSVIQNINNMSEDDEEENKFHNQMIEEDNAEIKLNDQINEDSNAADEQMDIEETLGEKQLRNNSKRTRQSSNNEEASKKQKTLLPQNRNNNNNTKQIKPRRSFEPRGSWTVFSTTLTNQNTSTNLNLQTESLMESKNSKWTDELVEQLKNRYQEDMHANINELEKIDEIAKEFGRSPLAIVSQLQKMGFNNPTEQWVANGRRIFNVQPKKQQN